MTPLENMLIRHEGLRLYPYPDTRGKTTIGVGRNLTDVGISKPEAMEFLRHDIAGIYSQILGGVTRVDRGKHTWILDLGPVRRDVVIMMIFNMGMRKFLGFKLAIKAMKAGEWKEAEHQMLYTNGVKSPWHKQVKGRARKLGRMMRSGKYK